MPVRENEPRQMDEWMAEVEERLRQLEARALEAGDGTELDQTTDTLTAKISEDVGNITEIGTDGGIYSTVATLSTPCIEVLGDGTDASPVTASPIISAATGNILTCETDGLTVLVPRAFEAVYAQRTTDLANAAGVEATVVTAPAVTVDGTVRVRITICWAAIFGTANDRLEMRIKEGATILGFDVESIDNATAGRDTSGGCYAVELTPASGSHTYSFISFGRTGGPTLEAGTDHPASIRVEDARW